MAIKSPDVKAPTPGADTLPLAEPAVSALRPRLGAQPAGLAAESGAYDQTVHAGGTVSKTPPLPVGSVIGERYVLEQHVSSGGFGAVYRASDRQIRNHHLALKLLHTPAADEQARQGALRELTLIASVSHPSVVQFKDYGWHEGRLWFAMPWYRGATLAQRYSAPGWTEPITRALARPIFERTAQGLAAMHEVGINHHDIKPDNIFLAEIAGFEGGLPVLLDLGIASSRDEGPKGMTIEYAAPEIAAAALGGNDKPIGPAADVFSLALVLRNLLQPQTAPVLQGEAMAFLHKRATEPVAPPSGKEFRHLHAAFARWLHLDPEQRPTAAQLASELALLTAPEEQRKARLRLLRRLAPVAALTLAVVIILLTQVRKESQQLAAEKNLLDQQIKTTEELRARSLEQLKQLEAESKSSGGSDRGLERATANARQFRALLDKSEHRADSLDHKLHQLTQERDALGAQRDAAITERDQARAELATTRQVVDAVRQTTSGTAARRKALHALAGSGPR
ncbi:MAG TPA: protein kinase [Polyangiales bacterium]